MFHFRRVRFSSFAVSVREQRYRITTVISRAIIIAQNCRGDTEDSHIP
jgi:hypothetical protein